MLDIIACCFFGCKLITFLIFLAGSSYKESRRSTLKLFVIEEASIFSTDLDCNLFWIYLDSIFCSNILIEFFSFLFFFQKYLFLPSFDELFSKNSRFYLICFQCLIGTWNFELLKLSSDFHYYTIRKAGLTKSQLINSKIQIHVLT